MNNTTFVEVDIGGKIVRFETGLLARQAAGAITLQQGENVLFSAVTCTKTPREGIDFFPLQIEYRDKFYAAGRFPGGYFKREARPSEKEILIARVTDRPIRPLFPEGYRNDVQIVNTLLATDGDTESDAMSVNAASAALVISEIPFMGPIAAVKVGRINGEFILNPTQKQLAESDLDLTYAGTRDHMLMVEGSAKEIPEADMLAAMKFGHPFVVKLIDAQLELRKKLGLSDKVITEAAVETPELAKARELGGQELADILTIKGKLDRQEKSGLFFEKLKAQMLEAFPEMTAEQYMQTFDKLQIETVRKNAVEKGVRIDGRGFDELRPLAGQVGLLPRVHGSALFNRGETQAMGVVTLGTSSDTQSMDAITGGDTEKKFMLHYNFPPYSTGEVGRFGTTKRREIGHGALAERSIAPVIPEDYPYTVRVVSEIMGSNGSSSMASICVGTLSLMDAGVPIKKPVAGISIGLITDEKSDKAILLTDILGAEDHCGDMDFKFAGTRQGITGFQVDLKIPGLRWDIIEGALERARVARGKILDLIESVLPAPRAELSPYAPRIHTMKIDPEKIGALIGPGGKNIRRITDETKAQIDIEDDGTVRIFSNNNESMQAAIREVSLITAEAEEGKIYRGTVTGIKDFGAFVEILPGKDGLVHISELADHRVKTVEDICKVGDSMWVKCIGIDDRGKIKLSRRAALKEQQEG
ncbi:MAG: polyribonucleotide nucleotidyltransferase [Kiritimatiellae bacterium]|nr:polyribonucleotide nucleotidyltransferase [Kiritimatiellia bacterium]